MKLRHAPHAGNELERQHAAIHGVGHTCLEEVQDSDSVGDGKVNFLDTHPIRVEVIRVPCYHGAFVRPRLLQHKWAAAQHPPRLGPRCLTPTPARRLNGVTRQRKGVPGTA